MSLDSASWELHQYLRRECEPMKNPKVETRSQDSNSKIPGFHDPTEESLSKHSGKRRKCFLPAFLLSHNIFLSI